MTLDLFYLFGNFLFSNFLQFINFFFLFRKFLLTTLYDMFDHFLKLNDPFPLFIFLHLFFTDYPNTIDVELLNNFSVIKDELLNG